ncbi:MAG: hypothetical protein GX286_01235 [Clostridiales bacterium]|jgi:hypothetical protein|nr:hypothetical protein [Clostridiales bacterium]
MVDTGTLNLILKFGLLFFGILGLVFVVAILTPYIANLIKQNDTLKKSDENYYGVKGIYDAQTAEDDKENLNNKDENDG